MHQVRLKVSITLNHLDHLDVGTSYDHLLIFCTRINRFWQSLTDIPEVQAVARKREQKAPSPQMIEKS